jgi:hypothetical protein
VGALEQAAHQRDVDTRDSAMSEWPDVESGDDAS